MERILRLAREERLESSVILFLPSQSCSRDLRVSSPSIVCGYVSLVCCAIWHCSSPYPYPISAQLQILQVLQTIEALDFADFVGYEVYVL
jgi:hypothetical protein